MNEGVQPENRKQNPPGAAAPSGQGRMAPQDMPRELSGRSRAPRQLPQSQDHLPVQKPVTDEEETVHTPSKLRILLTRILAVLLLLVGLSLAYVFLLLGEPGVEAEPEPSVQEETIQVPMAGMEGGGNVDLSAIAVNFGKPILALYGNALTLQKVTLYDTAHQGGYARRATLIYAFDDGQLLKLESIRPTSAAGLLKTGQSYLAGSMYSMAGMSAARMDSGEELCIFAKGAEAVYAITFPSAHAADVSTYLKQTTLLEARTDTN